MSGGIVEDEEDQLGLSIAEVDFTVVNKGHFSEDL